MSTFVYIWALLEPKLEYTNLMMKCKDLWDSFPLDKQRRIYRTIRNKKLEKKFVDYNPLLAIRNNIPLVRRMTMSFNDYYNKYGTTEETDGWHMENPTGNKVIFVKNE